MKAAAGKDKAGRLTPDPDGDVRPVHSRRGQGKMVSFSLTFILSFATWLVLSGRFDRFHLLLGILSSALVGFFSGGLLLPQPILSTLPRQWFRFCVYLPWLLVAVFKANMHILCLVFDPRMPQRIEPSIVRFNSRLTSDMARFILANAITLTPGTITIYASVFGEYTVHAIDRKSAAGLPGSKEERVARIFGE